MLHFVKDRYKLVSKGNVLIFKKCSKGGGDCVLYGLEYWQV